MTVAKPIHTLIFDLDGTLVDSLADIALAVNLMRRDFGLPSLSEEKVGSCVGDGSRKLVQRTLRAEVDDTDKGLELFLKYYRDHCLDHTRLMPGASEVLAKLSHKNLAVVTNKLSTFAEEILRKLGIRHLFGLVLGGDSTERVKPDPEPVVAVIDYFQTPRERAMIVGDNYTDVEAGKAAGIWTCFVRGIGKPGRNKPDIQIETLSQLPPYIL